ncbi:MAG: LON peptidase substrate-binding domain-containing protein [Acidobacteriota bacterium]
MTEPLDTTPLPPVLRVFPLTGSLLLPGNFLPLHVFEPRYRNMVEDALASDQMIGMIQPRQRGADDLGLPDPYGDAEEVGAMDRPDLYAVGCVGRIDQHREMPDGRYVLALVGVARFRVKEELDLHRGYRRVSADYEEFESDVEPPPLMDGGDELLQRLEAFSLRQGMSLDTERIRKLPESALVNGLAMALPFAAAEKQALLEASPQIRPEVLMTLLDMGLNGNSAEERSLAPTDPN